MNNQFNGKYSTEILEKLLMMEIEDEIIRINKEEKEQNKEKTVDMLLDEYNDSLDLFKMFKDEKYKVRANRIMKNLKQSNYKEN